MNEKIHILQTKNLNAQKLGLLNHRILPKNEGLLFTKRRWFHTFGMHFSICVLSFDKNQELISKPEVIEPNRVFICPRQSNYVVEIHAAHKIVENELVKNKIFVFNDIKSRIVFHFLKLLPLCLILLSFYLTFNNAFALNDINLNLGKTRTINLEQPPQSIQIDDPDVLELERVGISNSIKIIPKQPGKTSLNFQYFDGNDETMNVNVSSAINEINQHIEQSQYQEQIPQYIFDDSVSQIKKIPGVNYSVNSGKIFILGKMDSIQKFKEITKVIAPRPNLFFPSFEIDIKIESKIIDSLNTDIHKMGNSNLNIIRSGERFLLKGVYSSEANKEKVWSYLSATLPNIIDSTNAFFGESNLVQINIDFFEVGKANKKDYGVKYPNLGAEGIGLSINPLSSDKPTFQIAPFSVFFRALEARNYVREIAKPVIITRSGEKASFLAGGEVPIPAVTASGPNLNVSVNFKSVGVIFDVTPRVNDDGTIWLKLNVEYSQVNEKLSFQNAPGFNSRKVNTNIILREGTTAIISGLIQNSEIKKMEGIPVLQSLPIIGELFKSKNYANDSTELWIAVSAIHKNIENSSIKPTKQMRNDSLFNSFESIL